MYMLTVDNEVPLFKVKDSSCKPKQSDKRL